MDDTDNAILALARETAFGQIPPIPYCGLAGGRFYNPPAPHLEICMFLSGSTEELRIGEIPHQVSAGEICFHNVHFGNTSDVPVDYSETWCIFFDVNNEKLYPGLSAAPFLHQFSFRRREMLFAAFAEVNTAVRLPSLPVPTYPGGDYAYQPDHPEWQPQERRYRLQGALLKLFATLQEEIGLSAESDRSTLAEQIHAAMRFLQTRYRDPDVSLEELATEVCWSSDHLGREFRKAVGITPMRYLKQLRIRQAEALLLHTDMRISEIAEEVGFIDPYHFSRVFRNETRISPRQFRQRGSRLT